MDNRLTTQIFEIRNIITGHCGKVLSPDLVDELVDEFEQAISKGACSWAFKCKSEEAKVNPK